jgi:hypothetical protein
MTPAKLRTKILAGERNRNKTIFRRSQMELGIDGIHPNRESLAFDHLFCLLEID